MSLRFVDSFDHYNAAHFLGKWTGGTSGSSTFSINTTAGRRGGGALSMNPVADWAQKSIDSQARWTVGFAVQFQSTLVGEGTAVQTIGDVAPLVFFKDGSNLQAVIGVDSSGFLHVVLPTAVFDENSTGGPAANNWSRVAVGTHPLNVNLYGGGGSSPYYYLEVQVTFSPAVGQAQVRVNGVVDINTAATLNTAPTGNASADSVWLLKQTYFSGTFNQPHNNTPRVLSMTCTWRTARAR